jgi:hypothetical protein
MARETSRDYRAGWADCAQVLDFRVALLQSSMEAALRKARSGDGSIEQLLGAAWYEAAVSALASAREAMAVSAPTQRR